MSRARAHPPADLLGISIVDKLRAACAASSPMPRRPPDPEGPGALRYAAEVLASFARMVTCLADASPVRTRMILAVGYLLVG
jgi:hypothetical protein